MKKIELLGLANILSIAKVSKMDDTDKYAVIKIMRELRPVATEINAAIEIARDKLKGEEHASIVKMEQEWDNLSDDERSQVKSYYAKYDKEIEASIRDLLEENFELSVKLSEGAYSKLIASNDFDVATMMKLENLIV